MSYTRSNALHEIGDGTSNTFLLAEVAGRPDSYIFGRKVGTTMVTGWAVANQINPINLDGWKTDGTDAFGPCAINCANQHEVYAFHTGGANMAYCDGRVRFVRSSITLSLMAAQVTSNGGEVVADLE
jgi:prepilin-type processing-associated H-X9-DG protein